MTKKDKKEKTQGAKKELKIVGISKRGMKTVYIGIRVVILGFIVLTRTDPSGQNWASHLSPFLIIGGYITIGIGIILPDKKPDSDEQPSLKQ